MLGKLLYVLPSGRCAGLNIAKQLLLCTLFFNFIVLGYSWTPPTICKTPSTNYLDLKISRKWPGINSSLKHVHHTPAIVDINGDSFSDIIAVVAPFMDDARSANGARLVALSGNPGHNFTTLWTYSNSSALPGPFGEIAVARTAKGGLICFPVFKPTISVHFRDACLTCIDFSGKFLFFRNLSTTTGSTHLNTEISIVSIDATGEPYIITKGYAFNSSGHMMWNSSFISSSFNSFTVSDLNNDGLPEIIYAQKVLNGINGTVYAPFKSALYETANDTKVGFLGVADFDHDGNGDILRAVYGSVSIWNNVGRLIASSSNMVVPGSVMIRDINNDGDLEFGIVNNGITFQMFTFNSTTRQIKLLWSKAVSDDSSKISAAFSVDLNGDGKHEVLYADETTFYIFSSTGTTLYQNSTFHRSITYTEYPVYVDLDNDGFGEIILINNNSTATDPIIVLSPQIKENWTPTTPVWTGWDYTVRSGVEEGFVSSKFSPNWNLPWEDRNFFKGAINSCWICTGVIDDFLLQFNPECIAQRWTISGQSLVNSSSVSSISLYPQDHVLIEGDFVLDTQSNLTIIVSKTQETGSLTITGSFIHNGFIILDLTNLDLAANQSIELKQMISSETSNSSLINTTKIQVITKQNVEPCDISFSQTDGHLSISLIVSATESCWICTGVLDPFFETFKPVCINRQWRISEQPGSNSSSGVSITLDSLVHVSIENNFVLESGSALNILVSSTGSTGTLSVDRSFVQHGDIVIDMRNINMTPNQPVELKQIITYGNSDSSSVKIEQVQVQPDESIDPCYVDVEQIPEQHSLSLLVSLSTQKSECEPESSNNDLVIGLTVGLVGGCFCFVLIVGLIIMVVVSVKRKRFSRKLAAAGSQA